MLALADRHKEQPDARVTWLDRWVREPHGAGWPWNERRLVLFTEWEATRRWLERRLTAALADLDLETPAGSRVAVFTGATSQDRREALKRAFNADPATEPLRILICTDAAREGINLQSRCHDLIHVDLPWNPARLEQRNGRIDRKLQPSAEVWCRYFLFEQREEDIVLDALVRKTEFIRKQLGSAGQVIGDRIADRLMRQGISRARQQAAEVDAEQERRPHARARDGPRRRDARRQARLKRELDDLRRVLADSQDAGRRRCRGAAGYGRCRAGAGARLAQGHGGRAGRGAPSCSGSALTARPSTSRVGQTLSTTCGTVAGAAASGWQTGGQPARCAPWRSAADPARRHRGAGHRPAPP